jgi:hypothetical protein
LQPSLQESGYKHTQPKLPRSAITWPQAQATALGKRWRALFVVWLREAEKCIVLCANCHAETHHPEFDT